MTFTIPMDFVISPDGIKFFTWAVFFILLMCINNSVNSYFYGSIMSTHIRGEEVKNHPVYIKLRNRAIVQIIGELILLTALILWVYMTWK